MLETGFVDAIKSDVKSTFNRDVIGGIGSFAGAYSLPSGYRNPSSTICY